MLILHNLTALFTHFNGVDAPMEIRWIFMMLANTCILEMGYWKRVEYDAARSVFLYRNGGIALPILGNNLLVPDDDIIAVNNTIDVVRNRFNNRREQRRQRRQNAQNQNQIPPQNAQNENPPQNAQNQNPPVQIQNNHQEIENENPIPPLQNQNVVQVENDQEDSDGGDYVHHEYFDAGGVDQQQQQDAPSAGGGLNNPVDNPEPREIWQQDGGLNNPVDNPVMELGVQQHPPGDVGGRGGGLYALGGGPPPVVVAAANPAGLHPQDPPPPVVNPAGLQQQDQPPPPPPVANPAGLQQQYPQAPLGLGGGGGGGGGGPGHGGGGAPLDYFLYAALESIIRRIRVINPPPDAPQSRQHFEDFLGSYMDATYRMTLPEGSIRQGLLLNHVSVSINQFTNEAQVYAGQRELPRLVVDDDGWRVVRFVDDV